MKKRVFKEESNLLDILLSKERALHAEVIVKAGKEKRKRVRIRVRVSIEVLNCL